MPEVDPRILVIGGTSFIGRAFCEALRDRFAIPFVLMNRGLTNPDLFEGVPRIRCDHDDAEQCRAALAGTAWSAIVDFIGREDHHVRNVLTSTRCDHYTFVSSSAVELSWPADLHFGMALHKLWCEQLAKRLAPNVLVVRPGFVCGAHDYTGRFEMTDGLWYWRGTRELVRPMIRVELLANMMAHHVRDRKTGLLRAGYVAPGYA
jgi:nucleoside-diphosphate-sugar epimerase